jgi:hypothetical protein
MQTDVLEHRAVKAWMRLQTDGVEPEGIEVLDRKKRAWIKFRSELVQPEDIEILQEKRLVYRLKGVGPEGSAVIAKQCEKGDGMLQHIVYEESFPAYPFLLYVAVAMAVTTERGDSNDH